MLIIEFHNFFGTRHFFYSVHKRPLLDCIFNQLNSVHILTLYFKKIQFNIILLNGLTPPPPPPPPPCLFPYIFRWKSVRLSWFLTYATCPSPSNFL